MRISKKELLKRIKELEGQISRMDLQRKADVTVSIFPQAPLSGWSSINPCTSYPVTRIVRLILDYLKLDIKDRTTNTVLVPRKVEKIYS